MGIEGIKNKGVSTPARTSGPAPTKAADVEAPPAPPPLPEPASAEGYDAPKKKLMSVSGRFKASPTTYAARPDLQNLVAAQRTAVNAAGGPRTSKPATPIVHEHRNNASQFGKEPPARAADADFLAQAKKAHPKASAEAIEKAACALAKEAIEKKFGVSVKSGNAKWSAEELTRAYEGFSMMPAKDQAVLKGMDLVRDHRSGDADAGAEYRPNEHGERRAIAVFDDFANEGAGGTRTYSIHAIIHEAGHAVEQRQMHDAEAAANKAFDAMAHAEKRATRAKEAENRAWGAEDDSGTVNWAIKEFGRAGDKKGVDFLNAQGGVTNALHDLSVAKTPKQVEAAEKALATAKGKRDKIDMSEHPKSFRASDWTEATDKLETAIRDRRTADGELAPLKKDAADKQKALDAISMTEQTPDGDVLKSTTRANYEEARAKDKRGHQDVSPYGAESTVENFAEAYALYVRDRDYLKKNSPEQYKYFAKHHPQP